MQGGSGYAREISYENINFNSVRSPIEIDQYYCPLGNCANKVMMLLHMHMQNFIACIKQISRAENSSSIFSKQ